MDYQATSLHAGTRALVCFVGVGAIDSEWLSAAWVVIGTAYFLFSMWTAKLAEDKKPRKVL